MSSLREEFERSQTVAAESFFWFGKAAEALGRMKALAFDISKESVEEFEKAKADFYEAKSRCEREFRNL